MTQGRVWRGPTGWDQSALVAELSKAVPQHLAIIDAIYRCDSDGPDEAMRLHLESVADAIRASEGPEPRSARPYPVGSWRSPAGLWCRFEVDRHSLALAISTGAAVEGFPGDWNRHADEVFGTNGVFAQCQRASTNPNHASGRSRERLCT